MVVTEGSVELANATGRSAVLATGQEGLIDADRLLTADEVRLVREAFAGYASGFVSIDVLLTWGTTRFSSVVVRHDPRAEGVSGYGVKKLLTHALNMLTGYSAKPLQVASFTGFAFTVFGLFVLVYVLVLYVINGGSVPGFPFLASVVAIFSGAQLFALGIIGEYLARIHFRMMDRPSYAVRNHIGGA